jgi:invasion protein IalB
MTNRPSRLAVQGSVFTETAMAKRNRGSVGQRRALLRPSLRPWRVVLAIFGLAVTAMATGAAGPVKAQGAVRSVHGEWQIRCDKPAGAQTEQCALIQSVTAEDRPNIGLTVIILKTADQKARLMRVLAPLGVLLPAQLGLQIDQNDLGRADFIRCLPNGCIAEVVIDEQIVERLRAGTTATFVLFQTPEEGIGIPMSLKGFAEGFARLP